MIELFQGIVIVINCDDTLIWYISLYGFVDVIWSQDIIN